MIKGKLILRLSRRKRPPMERVVTAHPARPIRWGRIESKRRWSNSGRINRRQEMPPRQRVYAGVWGFPLERDRKSCRHTRLTAASTSSTLHTRDAQIQSALDAPINTWLHRLSASRCLKLLA